MERFATSPFNIEVEGAIEKRISDKIVIYDTTLRDGEQMVGVSFGLKEKLAIAKRLAAIGVPQIEAGFPAVSKEERETIKALVDQGLGPKILVLSRLLEEDVDAAVDSGADMVMLFIGTSQLHMTHKLAMGPQGIKDRLATVLDYTRERGIEFSFTPEDSTRSDWMFQTQLMGMAVEAGASRIGIADTTGSATPEAIGMLVGRMRRLWRCPISLHLHNDFGLALANALSGIQEGATHINASVSGIGERAGNVPLEQLVTALQVLYGIDLGIDMEGLTDLSRTVARLAKVPISYHAPIVGKNAFSHESGIHVAAVLSDPCTYEPIPPDLVGNERRIFFGKHSGRTAIRMKLEEKGLKADPETVHDLLERVKTHGGTNGGISEKDLLEMAKGHSSP